MPEKPLVYLILGAAGSGRREVLADLVNNNDSGKPAVLLAASEDAGEFDAKLPGLARWTWSDDIIAAEAPAGSTHVFFIADGRGNPVDQVEAFSQWLEETGAELARVLCVVDCRLAEKNPPLLAWYDACIHFADVVLLNRREGVANKWLSAFQRHYADQFLPCLFETVKAGKVKNPALILEPQARRMSHVFDEELNWEVSGDEENEGGDEEISASPETDPYLERRASGRRVKELPDIGKFLGA